MRSLTLLASSLLALPLAAQIQPHKIFDAPLLRTDLTAQIDLLGDVDNDGDLDAIAFEYFGNTVLKTSFVPLLNDGLGNLSPGTSVPIPPQAGYHVHWADVDGDGLRDVLVATSTTHAAGAGVLVFRGLPNAQFAPPVHLPLPGNVVKLGSGNANGDAIADVFVLHFTAAFQPQARWLLGAAALPLPLGPNTVFPGLVQTGCELGDLDGDGLTDFALLDNAGTAVSVSLHRTTPAGFTALGSVGLPGAFTHLLTAMDLEPDGDTDLLVTSFLGTSSQALTSVRNQGVAGFVATTQTVNAGAIYAMTPADWDLDGDPDLVARRFDSSTVPPTHWLTMLRNDAGTFSAQRTEVVPGQGSTGGGCADLDGDGRPDFAGSRMLLFGTATLVPEARPTTVFTSDWDGDGDLDHVLRPELATNDGRGVFTMVPGFWPQAPAPNHFYRDPVMSGDFDGDGLQEMIVPLVFAPFPSGSQFVGMRRLEANGNGVLADVGAATAAVEILQGGVVVDADGDGDPDFVNFQGVWQNGGTGTFTLLPQTFQNYRPVAKGDVDGDLDQDLLAIDTMGGVAVLYRTAPATYSITVLSPPMTTFITVSTPLLADLDDDGDLDVVANEQVGFSIGALPRLFTNAAGVFTPAFTLPFTGTFAAGDVDGDGATDLCIQESDRFRLFRRTGPGLAYAPATTLALRGAARLADLDQDGDLDVLGTPTTWNRRFVPPNAGYRRQYGDGSAGTGGRRPLLSSIGPVRAGLTTSARVVAGYGGSFGVLVASAASANLPNALPGVTAYIGAPFVSLGVPLGGALGQPGAGSFELPIVIPPGAGGAQLFLQCLVLDPAAPIALTHSNGCELFVGL